MKNLRAFRALCLLGGFAFAVAAAPVHAQQPASMPGMDMSGSAGGKSTQAFKAADDKMMQDMSADYTGDADKDFVAHMIPHHQGAIEMAQVELKYGKDPELKRLASNIIKAQHDEIAFMKKWQAKHGVK
ncbi:MULTISPECIES: CopM family metallochaperone [Paraburkholderia]|jgi:uncharacterized protein (DUF305 family)|uniref:CopM family metallochaperone n=1 Tax=Paraburkholderia TaxID=1822464 RepID=UPI0038B7DFF0